MGENSEQGWGGGRGGGGLPRVTGAFLPHSGPFLDLDKGRCAFLRLGGSWRSSGQGWRPQDPPGSTGQILIKSPPEGLSSVLRGAGKGGEAPLGLARGLSLAHCPTRGEGRRVRPLVCISVQRPRKCVWLPSRFQQPLTASGPAPVVLPGCRAPSVALEASTGICVKLVQEGIAPAREILFCVIQ